MREAHDELVAAAGLRFIGNVEGRDLLRKAADVVVCDGFTGNMALKLLEGTIQATLQAFRDEVTDSARGKLGGLLIRPAARALRTRLDPDTYGGAYLLGLRGPRRHRPRQLVGHGDRQRGPLRGPRRDRRSRRPGRRAPRGAGAREPPRPEPSSANAW